MKRVTAANARGSQSSFDCPDLYLEAEAGRYYRPDQLRGDGLDSCRGIAWALLFSSPIWIVGLIVFLSRK